MNIGRTEVTPQVAKSNDGTHWTRTLALDRDVCQDNLREIWNQFVVPDGWRGAGQSYASEPSFYRLGRFFVFEQSGGLDV
jgi:hypothetical protein